MALLSYDEALTIILQNARPLEAVKVSTKRSNGYHLASDIVSLTEIPRFNNSQMDGFAVWFDDVRLASPEFPVRLLIVGVAAAGIDVPNAIKSGETTKIFTGAPLPSGADTIVPIEDVIVDGDGTFAVINTAPKRQQFVRYKGEDVQYGEVVLAKGTHINAGRVALLLSCGQEFVEVYRRPRAVVLTNGDELVDISTRPEDLVGGQIYDSNGVMLSALVEDAGAELAALLTIKDSRDQMKKALLKLIQELNPDIIISTGGVSVGDRDFIRNVLGEIGQINFWRAAIRPGKPILYASIGAVHFLGLPGNPASTLVTFELFARPLINRLKGSLESRQTYRTQLTERVSHETGRTSFIRATTSLTKDGLRSAPAGGQGSHFVTSLARANSLIVLRDDTAFLEAGSFVDCLLLEQPLSA